MKTLTPTRLSQVILDDLAKSNLTEQDALSLGWFQDKHGNLVMPYGNGSSLKRTRLTVPISRRGKLQRYFQPAGSSPELYLPCIGGIDWRIVKSDPDKTFYITEGEKKAAIACKVGLPCIGLGGVDCWARKGGIPLPQWDEFNFDQRHVVIIFDSDILDKASVQLAERRLAHMLHSRGAKVSRLRMSENLLNDCIRTLTGVPN
jgi:Domain of unknown function (DUF3854)